MRSCKKLFIILITSLMLLGCSSKPLGLIEDEVEFVISRVNKSKPHENQNHNKGFFSYYLPLNVGVLRANKISTVLLIDGSEVFMGLNVSEVLSNKIENNQVNQDDFVLVKNFSTDNNENKTVANQLIIEQLDLDQYLIYLKVNEVFFVSSLPRAAISSTLENMLIISRTIDVDKRMVVAEFSNKEEMNYQQQVIELFSESVPEEGFLKEIYANDKEDD